MQSFMSISARSLLLSVVLAGCVTAPGPRYYTLSAYTLSAGDASSNPADDDAASYSVALGPVTLPEFVDRPQLVVRVSATQVEIAESHRWAEPLDSEIPRVLAANLERELPGARVVTLDQSGAIDADYRVAVDVQRFDSAPGTAATVEVDWTIRRLTDGETANGSAQIREPTQRGSYGALVAAHARALEQVARGIARSLRAVTESAP